MNCEECSGLLIDYLEDLLDPEESGAVKEHLGGCRDCSLELEHYTEIRAAAREEALPEVSAGVLSSLSEAARNKVKKDKPPFWKKWSYTPILVPTISAVIALSVWFYYGQDGIGGIDTVTREVGVVKMKAPEKQGEAFGDSEDKEQTFALKAHEDSEGLIGTVKSQEQAKPPAESRIKPAAPSETGTSEIAPEKGALRKKDISEEELVTYREEKSASSELRGRESMEAFSETPSDEAASKSLLRAAHPILRDYAGELELARRQQAEGNCEASIATNKALLNSSPPPEVQASSYRSLAECYMETGDLPNAVASYKNLGRVDPSQKEYANKKLEEIKTDSAYMNYEGSDTDSEPAN